MSKSDKHLPPLGPDEELLYEHDHRGPVSEFFAPVAGYGVTITSFFRPTVTEQYPFEGPFVQPRFHGRHQLNRYADGLEKCIGCELCAWACPADAILVEAHSNSLTHSTRQGNVTARSTRSTTCVASSADSASKLAPRVRSPWDTTSNCRSTAAKRKSTKSTSSLFPLPTACWHHRTRWSKACPTTTTTRVR